MAHEMKLHALELLASEREKQKDLGFTVDHDEDYKEGELARAAAFFALPGPIAYGDGSFFPEYLLTPEFQDSPKVNRSTHHGMTADKCETDDQRKQFAELRIRDLAKAGGCVVAEIQRLQRLGGIEDPDVLPFTLEELNPD